MSNEIPFLAPGCFGSALMYRTNDMVCPACPFNKQCEPAHKRSLAAMRKKFGISEIPENDDPVRKTEVADTPERMVLPKKVRELLRSLDGKNLNIVGKMQSGANPFEDLRKFRYMKIACHLIMKLDVPVTQELLSKGMELKLGWASTTANAHARMAISALEHVGAIENKDGVISVRRK